MFQANTISPNPAFEPVIEALPKVKSAKVATHIMAKSAFEWLHPYTRPTGYYTYIGSLPNPAAKGKEVIWIVYPTPIPVSSFQVITISLR